MDSSNPDDSTHTKQPYLVQVGSDLANQEAILDRTGQNIGDPASELPDLDPDLLEVDYTNTRLKKLPPLRILTKVETINLRQNLLQYTELGDLQYLTSLTHLDLYDNRLTTADFGLSNCTNLISLDLSFNLIGKMEDFSALIHLKDLWLANNLIKRIKPVLNGCTSLRTLELGANKIKRIEHLEALQGLENLWLGKNRISRIESLDTLVNLRKLDLQVNRLTKIEGLESLVLLEELYLSHNRITRLENLDNLKSLTTLDVSNNWIEKMENLSGLEALTDLWVNHNRLANYTELSEISTLRCLTTLYLEGNPLASDTQYRVKVLLELPKLQQLDATELYHPGYIVVSNDVPHALKGALKV